MRSSGLCSTTPFNALERWCSTVVAPIGLGDVLIDILGLGETAIEAIGAVAARAGNPEVFAGDLVEIVRDCLKRSAKNQFYQ